MPSKKQNIRLDGEVALVTGGGRGLGLSISKSLANIGASVCLTGRNPEHLQAAVNAIRDTGGKAEYAIGDVADKVSMEAAVTKFSDQFGTVSILVNNAGIGMGGPFAETDPDDWWRVMEVNVKGPMLMSRLVLPDMLSAGHGHIINIGSYQAIDPAPMVSAYATSKAALLRLTDSLSAETFDQGVTIIAVSPGFVRTDMGLVAEDGMRKANPQWEGFDPDYVFEPSAISELVCQIATGKAKQFHGRLLHVKDHLDDLLSHADEILAKDRFSLRFKM